MICKEQYTYNTWLKLVKRRIKKFSLILNNFLSCYKNKFPGDHESDDKIAFCA